MIERQKIFEIISEEREYQDLRWGGLGHDLEHTISEWVLFIEYHLGEAKRLLYEEGEWPALGEIRKIAAMAVACMEHNNAPRRK